jgi:hypothetical protein
VSGAGTDSHMPFKHVAHFSLSQCEAMRMETPSPDVSARMRVGGAAFTVAASMTVSENAPRTNLAAL